MSAPTFETLSTEVTQALTEQRHTPHKTTARCTLGRDKVMVLVEYPLSAKAEQTAMKTLNWLEQHLRSQFNTVGLPEEAADLAESGDAVPVHLFLKYFSESKPFTMRSFVWKVEDSFEALFGSPSQRPEVEGSAVNGEPVFHNSSDYDFPEMLPVRPARRSTASEDDRPVFAELENASSVRLEEREFDFEAELTSGSGPTAPTPADGSDADFFALLDEEEIATDNHQAASAADLEVPLLDLANWQDSDDGSDAAEVASEIADEIADEMSRLTPAHLQPVENDLETAPEDSTAPDQTSELRVPEDAALETLPLEAQLSAETETPLEVQSANEADAPLDAQLTDESADTQYLVDEPSADSAFRENIFTEVETDASDEAANEYETDYEYEQAEYEQAEYEQAEYEETDEEVGYYLEGDEEDAWEESVALIDDDEVARQRDQWQQQSRGGRWIFAGALGFVVIGVLGFVLSRPCTLGGCRRLQTAQATGDAAIASLQTDTSSAAVNEAKQQLRQSIQLLEPIPMWSSYHAQAQEILPLYENQWQALEQVSQAQAQAYQTALMSQDPPHSVSTWQEVAQGWLLAANALKSVPDDSPVRGLADRKLAEYRANRATILVRIEAESQAEESLRQAQQAASLGSKQAEAATSLDDWETALASWETAVESLRQIPQGTYVYGEAQETLSDYQEQIAEVRDRTQQERSASRELSEAKQLAAEAKQSASEDQWTNATQRWKKALSQLEEIEASTAAHAEAQLLIGLYTTSLKKAENSLEVALRFQPIEPSFFAACGTTASQKCTYSVRAGNVRLELFQGYDSVIDQSITPPDQRSGIVPAAQLVSQSNQLLERIAQLSTQAQVPVEIYDAKGDFLARYRPDLKGFVR